ncbi:hypothetical protein VCB98_04400 [Gammaproteobacteria bacterium AB-CW1]|uniref:Uncharacterized protein n=1 Tax=Natronospira elongata TaxID=3110268 RepID=A0AAP6JHN2_9GAMM|nr:hypothetical protein [Gammaproteobacteria bacterium AB-CW1]
MNERNLEILLIIIRALIAICSGMVAAMLCLAAAFWLQAEVIQPTNDVRASAISFLLPFFVGGLITAGVLRWQRYRSALLLGLGFALVYLLMFIPGWLGTEEIGAGLITGLVLGGLALALIGASLGFRLRQLITRQ